MHNATTYKETFRAIKGCEVLYEQKLIYKSEKLNKNYNFKHKPNIKYCSVAQSMWP